MIALRILCAIIFPAILWLLAALLLQNFEIEVRALRPWQRTVYGLAAFVAGAALAARIAGWL